MRPLLLALVVAVPIVGCSTSNGPQPAATTTSTRVAAEAESEPSPPSSASYRAGRLASGALVEGDPRWLATPTVPTTKHLDGDCSSLADEGWEATCERVASELGDAVWIREHQGQQERASLYVHQEADAWDLAWRASDESGVEFDSEVLTADLVGDEGRRHAHRR